MEGRYNHKMHVCQTPTRDYLAVFGGRNTQSDIIGEFTLYPISIFEGDIVLREPRKINPNLSTLFSSTMGQLLSPKPENSSTHYTHEPKNFTKPR